MRQNTDRLKVEIGKFMVVGDIYAPVLPIIDRMTRHNTNKL